MTALTSSETCAPEGRERAALSRRALLLGASAAAVAAALPAIPVAVEAAPAARGPMTLPLLKELSERALPILQKHFPTCLPEHVFLAEPGDNYHGLIVYCDCPADDRASICRCECQWHPLAGTPMVGGMSGYYEPEWDEETTYEALQRMLEWSDKPTTMTAAEWVEALQIVGMTPESQAARAASWERFCAGLGDSDEPANGPVCEPLSRQNEGVGR